MKIDLKDKNILITGASRGIGAGIAEHLGQSGARLALHYNSSSMQADSLAKKIGNNSFAIKADLAVTDKVIGLFDQVLQKMLRIDVLVNNAGIALNSPMDRSDKEWLESFRSTIDINLVAASLLCKKAIAHFMENKGGIIINISSRAAFRGDTSEYIAYAASKGGIVSLTKSIAKEYGRNGITAFNIAPGFVKTDMAQQFLEEYGEDHLKKDIALNRITEPADLGPIVTLLASGMAEHATGTTIDINAGSYLH